MRRYIACMAMLCCVFAASAQLMRDSVGIYFRQGSTLVDVRYKDNAQNVSLLSQLHRLYSHPQYWLKGIRIVSSSSPEGKASFNERLSRLRAESVMHYLPSNASVDTRLFQIHSMGEDWKTLSLLVAESVEFPYREEVLQSLQRYPGGQEGEWHLKQIAGGEAYRYLYKELYPLLRQTHVVFDVMKGPDPVVRAERPSEMPYTQASQSVPLQVCLPLPVAGKAETHAPAVRNPRYYALKTNGLYDLALVPNIGVEYYVGKQWSVAGNWMYAWWSNDGKNNFWRIYGGDVESRYWFGRKAKEKPLQGHHVGVYAQLLTYDIERGGRGYLADKWSYGIGISYGYSMPLLRRLNLDFNLGVGYLTGKYKEYLPIEGHYVWQSTNRLNWWGPTKAEVSLVWLLGRGNANVLKGGRR